MTQTNRRHFARKIEEANIQVLITPDNFTDLKDRCDFIPAKMVNQSEYGLYIESDRALQPGLDVHFKMIWPEKDHPEDAFKASFLTQAEKQQYLHELDEFVSDFAQRKMQDALQMS